MFDNQIRWCRRIARGPRRDKHPAVEPGSVREICDYLGINIRPVLLYNFYYAHNRQPRTVISLPDALADRISFRPEAILHLLIDENHRL